MTPWDVIAARMEVRGIRTEYALAKLLSQVDNGSFDSARRNINRWKHGQEPNEKSRRLLAELLGGNPADYAAATERDEDEVAQELSEIRSRLAAAERRLAELKERRDDDS